MPNTLINYCIQEAWFSSLNPLQFTWLSNLQNLNLNDNQINSLSPSQFQWLSSLQSLQFRNNQISLLSPSQFQWLTNLNYLRFHNNWFSGAIPALFSGINLTNNGSKHLFIRAYQWISPWISNTICWEKPTWIQTARDQYFSGNLWNTDLDDLSRFWGTGQTINLCQSGASCNTTADCSSGTCSSNGNPSGMYTCQWTWPNQSPTISLIIPDNIAPLVAPATIAMEAIATDSDGTIANVQFRNGSTWLNTDTSYPYTYNRTGVWAWTYTITAIATDNSGATTTSTGITVYVIASWMTTYTLTGTLWITGASASVNVCGSSVTANWSGVFSRSMIASGTNCSGITATKTWYTCIINTQWPNPLTGNVSNVVGTCTPITWNQSPTVSLTSPSSGQTFIAPAMVSFVANATDPDGTIASVQFRNGSTVLNTDTSSPYSYSRTSVAAWTYTVTAVTTDNSGATTTSTAITITVQSSGGGWGGGNNNCTAGTYRNTLTNMCSACIAWYFCPGGVNGVQTLCPANSYCPAWAVSGTSCPNGTIAPAGSDSSNDCIVANQPDADNDGIPDSSEWTGDVDNDGTPNNQDTDSDNDGTTDQAEHTAPNNGDGNMDSIADRLQRTITTHNTPTAWVKTTLQITPVNNCTGTLITENRTEGQVWNDRNYQYPFGLNRIDVSCSSATIRVYYHNAWSLSNYQYRKYRNNNYSQFPVSLWTYSGVNFVEFAVVDWWNGDSDNNMNGIIRDPGGLWLYSSSGGGGWWGGGGWRWSTVNCWNGRIDTGEQCDDGNIRGGDWCSARCYKESWTITWWTTDPSIPATPKATMIKMLQETLDTLEMACEHEDDDRTKKIKNMRDMSREDRFDPEATLTNYCITKWYKNKWQKQAAMWIGEAIKIVTKITTLDEWITFREGEKPDRSLPYKDIKSNARYATYVNVAYDKWILDGLTDSHRNEKELKAFTPISASQLLLLLENAWWIENSLSISDEDQALDDVLWLILPAKQDLSPLKWKTISRAQAAKYIVNAFPDYFENYEYLVGNNAVYLWNILAWISKKNEAEQRSYIVDKINTLKNVNEATYGEKYKIDTEVIITFLEKVIN